MPKVYGPRKRDRAEAGLVADLRPCHWTIRKEFRGSGGRDRSGAVRGSEGRRIIPGRKKKTMP
jgi:hypothetical protein